MNLDAEKHKLILDIFEKAGFELARHINAITIQLDEVGKHVTNIKKFK